MLLPDCILHLTDNVSSIQQFSYLTGLVQKSAMIYFGDDFPTWDKDFIVDRDVYVFQPGRSKVSFYTIHYNQYVEIQISKSNAKLLDFKFQNKSTNLILNFDFQSLSLTTLIQKPHYYLKHISHQIVTKICNGKLRHKMELPFVPNADHSNDMKCPHPLKGTKFRYMYRVKAPDVYFLMNEFAKKFEFDIQEIFYDSTKDVYYYNVSWQ